MAAKLPCWRYSAAGPILVTSQDALDALGPEWVDSPAKVPASVPVVESPAGAFPVGDDQSPPVPKARRVYRWKKDRG